MHYYQLIMTEHDEIKVIFPCMYVGDGRLVVDTMLNKDGKRYFIVPSYHAVEYHYRWDTCQVKDIYNSIFDHFAGDEIINNLPVHYLDRTYGFEVQRKFIEEHKDSQFGYLFYAKNSIGDKPYGIDGNYLIRLTDGEQTTLPVRTCDTLEEITLLKASLVEELMGAIKDYTTWVSDTPIAYRDRILGSVEELSEMSWHYDNVAQDAKHEILEEYAIRRYGCHISEDLFEDLFAEETFSVDKKVLIGSIMINQGV